MNSRNHDNSEKADQTAIQRKIKEPARPSLHLLCSSIIAALGGLLFGFDTAVISGTTDMLQSIYNLSSYAKGFTVASALIGTIVGAISAGKPADRYGRRTTLLVIAVLYLLSAIGCALAWDWYSLLLFRFLGGLGVGGASVISPMYIAEISPARYRGRLVAITQFNIVLGILLAFFSNFTIAQFDLGLTEWRWMLGVEAFPAAAFFFLLFLNPLSPRWLVARNRIAEARDGLLKLGTDTGNVDEEINEIRASIEMEHMEKKEPLFQAKYRKPILLAIAIAAFNQLSGINSLMYYAPEIFKMAGAGKNSALLQSVAIGGTNLIFTMAALAIIDQFGRKFLMIVGSIGYIISLSATACTFYIFGTDFTETGGLVILISLLVFIASHAFGQGAVIWVFISEIFPNRVRARGQALGSFTHWFMAAIITWTFPVIADISGGHAFAFYAVMMVLQLLWVLLIMPETKGITLEKMQKKLGIS
ncbi:MAG: sugar porter family MFS transporter [Verrucomicrobia bacterium]|nr:sugar porter family MFS transporter [Verrucomicrobiota bacterium]MCF7707600.1 sugar porter family MFS transporter [Verrucomicrobiota bacterium]